MLFEFRVTIISMNEGGKHSSAFRCNKKLALDSIVVENRIVFHFGKKKTRLLGFCSSVFKPTEDVTIALQQKTTKILSLENHLISCGLNTLNSFVVKLF